MAVVESLDKLNLPGDIVIEEITIATPAGGAANLKELMMSIEIFEDMYSNSLSGSLVISDSLALSNHLPITGNERLKIVFYTPGQKDQPHKKIELNMVAYKIHKANVTDKAMVTVIDFVSEEFFINSMVRFSVSYKNMSYSEMAQKIFQEQIVDVISKSQSTRQPTPSEGRSLVVVPTTGADKAIVFPFWSPFYAINWLANKSHTLIAPPGSGFGGITDKKTADYLFFQQLNGNYMFAPVSYFKAQAPVARYRHAFANKQRDAEEFDNINEITIVSLNNKLQDVSTGVYSSVLNTFDINKKKIGGDFYRYKEKFVETQHTDQYPLVPHSLDRFSDAILSYIKVLPKNSYKYDGIEDNEEHEKYALLRQSQMNQLNCITLQIKVKGDSRRRVGDVIYLDIPSPESLNGKGKGVNNDGSDKYLAGNYLVTKINHSIGHQDYELVMTVSKDSYRAPVPDYKDTADTGIYNPTIRESRV